MIYTTKLQTILKSLLTITFSILFYTLSALKLHRLEFSSPKEINNTNNIQLQSNQNQIDLASDSSVHQPRGFDFHKNNLFHDTLMLSLSIYRPEILSKIDPFGFLKFLGSKKEKFDLPSKYFFFYI